jgi:hypothetical protein
LCGSIAAKEAETLALCNPEQKGIAGKEERGADIG